MKQYDVVIAGYGPTGAVVANLLGAAGVRCLIVEPNPTIIDIPRAVHFDGEVMRVFQALGLHDEIARIAAPASSLGFTNGRDWDLFDQDISAIPRVHLWDNSNFFNQPALEKYLREGVNRYDKVECLLEMNVSGFTQTDQGVEVQLSSVSDTTNEQQPVIQHVYAQYLLGCDGAASTVRKLLGVTKEDLGCDEPWLVVDWMLPEEIKIESAAFQICDPRRPATLVPCQGNHVRWEFMVNPDDDVETLEAEANVRSLIAPYLYRLSPDLRPDMGELVRAKVYHFHALIADSFQQERVFLLGDAAHQMPPFLGQGMCAGIRDAHNLCWKLQRVLNKNSAPDILASYTSERRPHVFEIIQTAVGHGSIIQNRNPVSAFLRDCYLLLGKVFPFLVSFLRFDLSWCLGPGLLDEPDAAKTAEDSVIGRPIPQAFLEVNSQDGSRSCRSDEMLGPEFTLVSCNVDPVVLAKIKPSVVELTQLAIGPGTDHLDTSGSFSQWFEQNEASVVLVRPDRQVFGICTADGAVVEEASAMIKRLERHLLSPLNDGGSAKGDM